MSIAEGITDDTFFGDRHEPARSVRKKGSRSTCRCRISFPSRVIRGCSGYLDAKGDAKVAPIPVAGSAKRSRRVIAIFPVWGPKTVSNIPNVGNDPQNILTVRNGLWPLLMVDKECVSRKVRVGDFFTPYERTRRILTPWNHTVFMRLTVGCVLREGCTIRFDMTDSIFCVHVLCL